MQQKELQTYISILKKFAKSSTEKVVEIENRFIKVKTPTHLCVLGAPVPDADCGIYSLEALDILSLDLNADISAYKLREVEGWKIDDSWKLYETETITKGLLDKLNTTAKFVSKDELRPALQQVHIMNGDIFGTDGYRAYITKHSQDIEYTIPKASVHVSSINAVSKAFKFGEWLIAYGKDDYGDSRTEFNNGYLVIWDLGCDSSQVPEMRKLLQERQTLTTDAHFKFPYKQVKGVANKDTEVTIGKDGSISINSRPLPLKVTFQKSSPLVDGTSDTIKVLMPLINKEDAYIRLDLSLMSAFTPDKEGNLDLHVEDNSRSIVIVA